MLTFTPTAATARQETAMSTKTKLAVRTDVGTFTRSTERTYSHVVVTSPVRAEVLEADRLDAMAHERREIARLTTDLAVDCAGAIEAQRQHLIAIARIWGKGPAEADAPDVAAVQADCRADLARAQARLAELEAEGVITEDRGDWTVLGWCGRLDLARKLASGPATDVFSAAGRARQVRIYDVTVGDLVHQFVAPIVPAEQVCLARRAAARSRRSRIYRRGVARIYR